MLWNAKMRMGKTLTSLEVVKRIKFHRTIIVTHRPVVDEGWFEDFGKIFYEDDTPWLYGSRNKGVQSVKALEKSKKNYIYFASMQDLRGSKRVGGNFDKNDDIFDTNWDLLIIDEAHEGTQTELGQRVQDEIIKDNTKVLHLSGTPFNLLGNFDEESVFTWDYVMEQRAKEEWYQNHPGDPNPYEELPKLNILTFNLGQLAADFQDEDKAFNFREFFRTWTGDPKADRLVMPRGAKEGDFIHEKEVANFLDIISSDDGETLYPFSSKEYREFFHHTFWIVPGVREGKALMDMLRTHPVFGSYKIVNVAGDEDDEASFRQALDEVNSAITDHPEDTYTITISCGKLTTGVTIRPWTAVLYLAGGKNTSPQTYMQTIFRVQSPAVIGGRQKTECYVFDFAPDRTLKMVAETAKISAKAGETEQSDREILGDFINFCPIIAYDGTEMKFYNVDQMLQQLKRVYVDKVVNSGFEDGHLYSKRLYDLTNVELEKFADLQKIIGQTKANKQSRDIDINKQGFDKEDIEKAKREAKRKGKEYTQKELEQMAEQLKKRRQRETAVSILRGISIRMPLMLFGARLDNEEENITLNRFVQLVDDESWKEFMPYGVTKEKFAEYKQYYDEDIFAASGRQIRELARQADKLSVLERIKRISEIFMSFRNPDKETVLTPWRVVNMHLSDTVGGYCFYDDDFEQTIETPRNVDRGLVTQRLFEDSNVRILEINSKSGLYPLYMAYSVFRHKMRVAQEKKPRKSLFNSVVNLDEQRIWRDVLAENIFVICKTEMARSITQRTLAGFSDAKINTHVYDNLLEQITHNQKQFINDLLTGKIFPQIKDNMKFTAIVGNPPYQVMDGGHGGSSQTLYDKFVNISKSLMPSYLTMIMPSRWMTGGKGLDDFRKEMLDDKCIRVLHDFLNAGECFNNVSIEGGICYFRRDNNSQGKCLVTIHKGDGSVVCAEKYLDEGGDIVIRDSTATLILNAVKKLNENPFSDIVSNRNPFNIVGNIVGEITTSRNTTRMVLARYENQRQFLNLKDSFVISKNVEWIDKVKLFVSKADGAAGQIGNPIPAKIIGLPEFGDKNVVCTETFLLVGPFKNKTEQSNAAKYMKTKFFRVLVGIRKNKNMTSDTYAFVPLQDFTSNSDIDWSASVSDIDRQLYKKYGLTREEIDFVEGMIKPME